MNKVENRQCPKCGHNMKYNSIYKILIEKDIVNGKFKCENKNCLHLQFFRLTEDEIKAVVR